jgi:cell division protein FtsQ
MARSSGSTTQEELYSAPGEAAREGLDDARLLDLDSEKESPFLRAQKRVPARRSALPKKTATRLLWCVALIIVGSLGAVAAASLYQYGEHSWRFRLESSDNIELAGLTNVTRGQIMEVMGGDIGRNIFFIPLDQRQKQLEQIPWVKSASVMRFAPDRIRIQVQERAPIAFARVGSKIMLVDSGGALMDLSAKKKYSFPVIVGMNSGEPISTRAARIRIYNQLVTELDSSGGHYSQVLSEVDLSDPEDVKVLTNDADGEVLVHLGSSNYLDRFRVYVAHLREWRQEFQKLESVDLRYDRQIIVNPDLADTAKPSPLSAAAARAAISAGVKPAALVSAVPKKLTPHTIARPAAIKAAVIKHPEKSRWKKHTAAPKTTHVGPVASRIRPSAARQIPVKPSSTQKLQKPSPEILKGQESR